MTITEALAEIKTVLKRIEAKRTFVKNYACQLDTFKDPLEKDGGSKKVVEQEMQAIADLEKRVVDLRTAINRANNMTSVSIEGVEKTIEGWLVWRREIAPSRQRFVSTLRSKLDDGRSQIRYGLRDAKGEPVKADMVVAVDENALNKEAEQIQNILGQLDGQLSLKNATVMID